MKPLRYEVTVKKISSYSSNVYTIKGTLEWIQARFMSNFNTDDYMISTIYHTDKPELQIDLTREDKEQMEKMSDEISTINAEILHKQIKNRKIMRKWH